MSVCVLVSILKKGKEGREREKCNDIVIAAVRLSERQRDDNPALAVLPLERVLMETSSYTIQ